MHVASTRERPKHHHDQQLLSSLGPHTHRAHTTVDVWSESSYLVTLDPGFVNRSGAAALMEVK